MKKIKTSFRLAWKTVFFVFYVLAYISVCLFWRVWTRDQIQRRHLYNKTVQFFCRLGLALMKLRVNAINPPSPESPYLLVSNHLGILDILILSSIKPTLFVTSVEMKNTPFLGLLTDMAGCLYVERRSRSQILQELSEIRQALKDGLSVALYPEGTSSNGERVLPFKKTLLTAAAGTGVPIKPVIVNFRKVNGEPMSDRWRDYVCWYGDLTFTGFLFRVFSLESVDVDLEFAHEVMVHSEEQRKEIAHHLQTVIESKYTPIPLL